MTILVRLAAAVTATSLSFAASPALACSVCGCGDPLGGVGQVAGPAGQLGLELDGQWLSQKADGDVPDTTDVLNQYSVLLTASYTPLANLNLVVTLPWVWKNMQMEMPDGSRMTSSNLNGFGDMQFGIRWFFWEDTDVGNRTRQTLSVSASTFAPTGNNSAVQSDVWSGYAGV